MSYAKVFRSLFDGSMRGQSDLILVFVNLLCCCDGDGTVDRTARAVADETGLPLDRVEAALTALESPDPHSRTPGEEGRRLVRLDAHRTWGWRIVNHAKYREMCSREQNAIRQASFRRRNASVTQGCYGALLPASEDASVLSSSEGKGMQGEGLHAALLATGKFPSLTTELLALKLHTYPAADVPAGHAELIEAARSMPGAIGSPAAWIDRTLSGIEARLTKGTAGKPLTIREQAELEDAEKRKRRAAEHAELHR